MPQNRSEKKHSYNKFMNQLFERTQSLYQQNFAEVEIGADTGQNSNKAQPILKPNKSGAEKHRVLVEMKHLSLGVRFPNQPYSQAQAALFYRQAKYMEQFEDDYEYEAEFNMYFPGYQMMNYEQLRTYFTWRTEIRKGNVKETSTSNVFLYIYELINHIGVESDLDGLDKLIFLKNEYRRYEEKLDRYMETWIKHYCIVYNITQAYEAVMKENETLNFLFDQESETNYFSFYAPLSDYKWKLSGFYSPETEAVTAACFQHVVKALINFLEQFGTCFEDLVLKQNDNLWIPFPKALYYLRTNPNDEKKIIRISDTEWYRYENGRWTCSGKRICSKNGKYFLGYLLRKSEQYARKTFHYKQKLQANHSKLDLEDMGRFVPDVKLLLEQIEKAVSDYDRISNVIKVSVDPDMLDQIRRNALVTQEKLLSELDPPEIQPKAVREEKVWKNTLPEFTEKEQINEIIQTESKKDDIWDCFIFSLNDMEQKALQMIMRKAAMAEIQEYSRAHNKMPEVLVDAINQKAIETVGDNVMEFSEIISLYDEYKEELERVVNQ